MIKIVKSAKDANIFTHPAPHHGDEVFAIAMLNIITNDITVMRTRNSKLMDENPEAARIDVGGVYDPDKGYFDHHQKSFDLCHNGLEEEPIKLASAGLIWAFYAAVIIWKVIEETVDADSVYEIGRRVDNTLIKGIDAQDNGELERGLAMSVSSALSLFNTSWDEESSDDGFINAIEFAKTILIRAIKSAHSVVKGKKLVLDAVSDSQEGIVILDHYVNGQLETILSTGRDDLLYVIFPALSGNWNVQCIPPSLDEMGGQRKPLPESWAGLNAEELQQLTDIPTAVFCHVNRFMAAAKNRDDTIALARLAMNA